MYTLIIWKGLLYDIPKSTVLKSKETYLIGLT